jgi:ABC-2 type transport system permease protein
MAGRTLGGATTALIQGTLVLAVCLVAGFRPHAGAGVLLGFVFMTLIAVVFAALGTIIGSALRDMQGFQLIMIFLVMPIFFLSGSLYPLSNLPAALAVATRLDPLSYGVDGLRGAFIDQSYFGVPTDLAVLVALATLFLALGARAFSRIQV